MRSKPHTPSTKTPRRKRATSHEFSEFRLKWVKAYVTEHRNITVNRYKDGMRRRSSVPLMVQRRITAKTDEGFYYVIEAPPYYQRWTIFRVSNGETKQLNNVVYKTAKQAISFIEEIHFNERIRDIKTKAELWGWEKDPASIGEKKTR